MRREVSRRERVRHVRPVLPVERLPKWAEVPCGSARAGVWRPRGLEWKCLRERHVHLGFGLRRRLHLRSRRHLPAQGGHVRSCRVPPRHGLHALGRRHLRARFGRLLQYPTGPLLRVSEQELSLERRLCVVELRDRPARVLFLLAGSSALSGVMTALRAISRASRLGLREHRAWRRVRRGARASASYRSWTRFRPPRRRARRARAESLRRREG